MSKKDWDKFTSILLAVLATNVIRGFFKNDGNQLISARGNEVLNTPDLMEKVNAKLKEQETRGTSGPIVVDLH